jgi:hypothetical protein
MGAKQQGTTDMSERRRPLTGQEMDQALRVEEMRKFRAGASGAPSLKPLEEADPNRNEVEDFLDDVPHRAEPLPPLAPPPSLPCAAADTETLLNGLIEECRYLLREVAFNSARLTADADDRIRFLSSAESLAMTGAKIADTVARLPANGSARIEERRHRVIYEHAQTPSPPSPRKKSPKNEKQ